jgi:hypothetical protein
VGATPDGREWAEGEMHRGRRGGGGEDSESATVTAAVESTAAICISCIASLVLLISTCCLDNGRAWVWGWASGQAGRAASSACWGRTGSTGEWGGAVLVVAR